MSNAAQDLTGRLEAFIREELDVQGALPLHEPSFEGREWEYVKDCIDTGWVSSVGSYVDRVEEMLAHACGTRYAVAVVNGTSALHMALLSVGVGDGDAVVCPALTFIATANAISYCGAVPIFADSEMGTLGLDANKLKKFFATSCERGQGGLFHKASGRRIAAIVPVHIFGHPVDMDGLCDVADEYGLFVVEDSAEALGSFYQDKPCGGLSKVGAISMNGNKTITSGGGGGIVTNDEELAWKLKHITTTARSSKGWEFDHDQVGFNYRMPNINAALACAQLEMLEVFVARKRALAVRYAEIIGDIADVSFVKEPPRSRSNYWLNAVMMKDAAARDDVLERTNALGIHTRPCWRLLSDTKAYAGSLCVDDLQCSRRLTDRIVNLPSGPALAAKVLHG